MVSHKKNQPLINIKQPSFQAEQPKMQTIFHYRKPNRDKMIKNEAKIGLDEQLIDEIRENKNIENKQEKLNFEIIEPVSNQTTNFTLFDLTQDPDQLIKNLMDSISNPDSSLNLNSIFNNSIQQIDNNVEYSEIEIEDEEPEKNSNIYESLSILEMAQDVLKDILENKLKKLDILDIETISSKSNHDLDIEEK